MSNTRQLREVSAALADLYAPGLAAENYVNRAFALTSRLVPVVMSTIGVKDVTTGILEANFDRFPPGLETSFSAFGKLMHKYAPTRFDANTNFGRPFSLRDFYSKPTLHNLDIYQEVYRPMGFEDHCFVQIRTNPGSTVYIGFFRDKGAFTTADKSVLEVIQPHLANARRLALATSAACDTPLSPELFVRAGFTPRESDVIYWLTLGKSNEEIASILRIRADSVSRNLQTIYTKMGVDHRVAAALHALSLAKRLHSEAVVTLGGAVNFTVPTHEGVSQG